MTRSKPGGQDRSDRGHKKAAKRSPPVIDPYLPANGNFGYRVSRYELDLEYKVNINRLSGTATITAATLASLTTFSLDLSDALVVSKVSVNGHRPASFHRSHGKLHVTLSVGTACGGGDGDHGPLLGHAATHPIPLGRSRFRGAHQRRTGRRPAERRGVLVPV